MEANLDKEYYQKYLKYKEKYIQLKQLKNHYNDLEGGMWPFSSKVKNPDTGTDDDNYMYNDRNTDGEYLVFYIDDEGEREMRNEQLDKYKIFSQFNYGVQNKQGIEFISKELFNNNYNEKAYIINKKGNNIICQIITNNTEVDFYKKIQTIKNNFYIEQKLDPIIENLSNKCYTTYINNVTTNLNKSIKTINNEEIKQNLEKLKSDFVIKSNSENEKQIILKNYIDLKFEINKTINNDQYLKYKTIQFVKGNYNFNQINNNSQIFFDELINKIKDNNKQKDEIIKLNMIIKIDKSKTHYKFAEYINKNNISYTTMYAKIGAALTNRTYATVKNSDISPQK